mgnify:CR=1 FL=1
MNLTERLNKQERGSDLGCPIMFTNCIQYHGADLVKPDCAHYNPKTDECIHVEAVRALVGIAESLKAGLEITDSTGDTDD